MRLTKQSKLIGLGYLIVLVYWCTTFFTGQRDSQPNYIYQFVFGLIPVIGGILGLSTAKKWGGLRSGLGKAIFFLSLGILSWGLGMMAWSYYVIFTDNKLPYPAYSDYGYAPAVFLWSLGIIYLSKATGAKFGLRKPLAKVTAVLLPIVFLGVSYHLLVTVARQGIISSEGSSAIKTFLDFYYPMGDVVIFTLATLVFGLSVGYLGGRYRLPIYILLFGFVVMYFADFSFSYTTTAGTYYNGHWVDLLFPTAMALMAIGVNAISPPKINDNGNQQPKVPNSGAQNG